MNRPNLRLIPVFIVFALFACNKKIGNQTFSGKTGAAGGECDSNSLLLSLEGGKLSPTDMENSNNLSTSAQDTYKAGVPVVSINTSGYTTANPSTNLANNDDDDDKIIYNVTQFRYYSGMSDPGPNGYQGPTILDHDLPGDASFYQACVYKCRSTKAQRDDWERKHHMVCQNKWNAIPNPSPAGSVTHSDLLTKIDDAKKALADHLIATFERKNIACYYDPFAAAEFLLSGAGKILADEIDLPSIGQQSTKLASNCEIEGPGPLTPTPTPTTPDPSPTPPPTVGGATGSGSGTSGSAQEGESGSSGEDDFVFTPPNPTNGTSVVAGVSAAAGVLLIAHALYYNIYKGWTPSFQANRKFQKSAGAIDAYLKKVKIAKDAFEEAKTKGTNLATAEAEFKKAFDAAQKELIGGEPDPKDTKTTLAEKAEAAYKGHVDKAIEAVAANRKANATFEASAEKTFDQKPEGKAPIKNAHLQTNLTASMNVETKSIFNEADVKNLTPEEMKKFAPDVKTATGGLLSVNAPEKLPKVGISNPFGGVTRAWNGEMKFGDGKTAGYDRPLKTMGKFAAGIALIALAGGVGKHQTALANSGDSNVISFKFTPEEISEINKLLNTYAILDAQLPQ